jgi:methyl-accepting chemotaxis protein
VDVTQSPDGPKAALAFVKQPATAVMEPAAYQGTMYVTYQAPVERAGKVVGYVGTANTLADVDKRISKTELYDHGYAFAVSAKGVLLSSPDKKNNGKASLVRLADSKHNPDLEAVAESIAAGRSGQVETTDPWTGKEVVLTWRRSTRRAGAS